MTPARSRNFILGFLGVLGLIAALLFFLSQPASPASVPPGPPIRVPPGRIAEVEPAAAPGPSANAVAAEPARQVLLERPALGQSDAGLRPIPDKGAPSGPLDRRENAGPHAGRELEIIRYAFETLEEDVQACLEQWEAAAPGNAAQVMIAFEIDAQGLQKSWLKHETEVPFGPRTCLANAVYGLDWSKIVDHPAMLTQRFELGRKDAG